MAMSGFAKLGLSAGFGVGSTLVTDSGLRYWVPRAPEDADATDVAKQNWYYRYSSLLGGLVSLGVAGVLWKVWGAEEALVCAVAGVGTALAVPAREMVDVARVKSETGAAGVRKLAALRQLRVLEQAVGQKAA